MTGYVNVAMLFIESEYDSGVTGSQDVYTWDSPAFEAVFETAWAGCLRWASMADDHGTYLTFSLGAGYPWVGSALKQPYEPILHSWGDYNLWLEPVMAHYGYSTGNGLQRVAAWNSSRKSGSGADGVLALVMVANDENHPLFSGGAGSNTWPGGPFAQMPYLYAVGAGAETAHEMGHGFWACDEYSSSGCGCEGTCSGGPRTDVLNCNCNSGECVGSHVACIMDDVTEEVVCPFTAQKINWEEAHASCEM